MDTNLKGALLQLLASCRTLLVTLDQQLIDLEAERDRLTKQIAELEVELQK